MPRQPRLLGIAILLVATAVATSHAQTSNNAGTSHQVETGYPFTTSIFSTKGDERIKSADRRVFRSIGPHDRQARTAINVELTADGSSKASDPLAADYVMAVSAFKAGYAEPTTPVAGEINGLLVSVRQDSGDTNVVAANGQLVDRGAAHPSFLSLFEGHATLLDPTGHDISQDIDVQLGGINSKDRSSLDRPSMHGLHAFKAIGSGGSAIYVDSRERTQREGDVSASWDYGLQIRQGHHTQLLQRSSDAGLAIFRHGSDDPPFLIVNGPAGLKLSQVDSPTATIITPRGDLLYDHRWTPFDPMIGATAGSVSKSTSTGKYSTIGNVCHIGLNVRIQENGTGAGGLNIVIPSSISGIKGDVSIISGREAKSGKMLQGVLSERKITVYNYDNSYPGGNGAVLTLNGSYECIADT